MHENTINVSKLLNVRYMTPIFTKIWMHIVS